MLTTSCCFLHVCEIENNDMKLINWSFSHDQIACSEPIYLNLTSCKSFIVVVIVCICVCR